MTGIGQFNEQHLHQSLKAFYAQDIWDTEVPVDGYVVDVVQGERLVEIQTGNFYAIRHKLTDLVKRHAVHLVYPIPLEKWLVKLPVEDKEVSQRRKSPKRGALESIFGELVSFPTLLCEENFTLELVLIQEEEVRRFVGEDRWRKNGWETVERRLLSVVRQEAFEYPYQLLSLLPVGLSAAFTTAELAKLGGFSLSLAQKMAYCLREMGAIRCLGKKGRYNLYERRG